MKVETLNLAQFKTGLELETEFNRIVKLAREYKMDHISADKLLSEIYDYGVKTNIFTKSEQEYYIKRRNSNSKGVSRKHLEFALNVCQSQKREHNVLLYYIKFLRNRYLDKKIVWEFYGSDFEGYIMIVDTKNTYGNDVTQPDYKIRVEKDTYIVESKCFFTPPTLKIANLHTYLDSKCYLIFKYMKGYYSTGTAGIKKLLKMKKTFKWGQDTVIISQTDIDKFIEKKLFMEFTSAE